MKTRKHALLLSALALLSLPFSACAEKWSELSAAQQQILAPLSDSWDNLPQSEHKSFIGVADAYPKLSPEKQQRLRAQIKDWAGLTMEQRHRAREKFSAFSKVPEEKREAVKRMVREQEAQSDKP
ncbi:DUF3106 domain-containing protein [Sideroxyarcus sp. TK5]|jgi:hypothetical protein